MLTEQEKKKVRLETMWLMVVGFMLGSLVTTIISLAVAARCH